MYRVIATLTTAGSDGAASASVSVYPRPGGRLYAVYLDYHASAPSTTDVTISQAEAPEATLLTVSDNKTDGWYFPRQQVCGTDGSALTYDGSHAIVEPFPMTGGLAVTVAQGDALTGCVTAYLYIQEDA